MREMVNHLMKLLDMEQPRENQSKWTELMLVRREQLKNQLMETRGLADVLPDRVSQVESLTLLRYELGLTDGASLPRPSSAELLNRAYEKIVSFSEIEMLTVPDWLIPEYALDVAADAIGDGSLGVVYHGLLRRETKMERVAVKYLRIYGLGGALSSQSFMEDVTTWHNLSHKNIIALYGACHVSRKVFLVSEQGEGGNLLEYLRVPENESNIWDRFVEAAQGLEYLHANDIIHGSLRCSNILISTNGTAKLTDFGFRAVRSAVGALGGATTHSQLQWTAPEYLVSDRVELSYAADVYSLGVCIMEAVLGGAPWGDLDEPEMLIEGGSLPDCPHESYRDAWNVVSEILTQSKGDAFFEYKVEIQLSSFNEATEARMPYIWRRYSEFRNFRDGLFRQNERAAAELPLFPSKILWGRTRKSTAQLRQIQLHAFLNAAAFSRFSFGVRTREGVTVFNTPESSNLVL
ncbi:Serine/threonine protein kinase [Globisporangium polare]